MPNRQARSPGRLTRLETQGQVSTKPGFAVDANAGVFRALQVDLRRMGSALGNMADRAMKRRERANIEAGKTQGQFDGYNVDLGGTGYQSTAQSKSDHSTLVDKIIGVESGGNRHAKKSR